MENSLTRTWLTLLGIGMVILWIVGLGSPMASRWLVWLDLVTAVLSFIGASATTPQTSVETRASGTIALSIGVYALWLIGLVSGATSWLVWWNFAFACAYLLAGIEAARRRDRGRESVPLRRSA